MFSRCCHEPACAAPAVDPTVRKALWIALVLNATMFIVEFGASWISGSVSLLADSIDFSGDVGNFAIILAVLAMGLATRAKRRWSKLRAWQASASLCWPRRCGTRQRRAAWAMTMGAVSECGACGHASMALMLYRFRAVDSNMRSVRICSRNDAVGNLAVLLAALGVSAQGQPGRSFWSRR